MAELLKLPRRLARGLADIDRLGPLVPQTYEPFADECALHGVTEITENRHTGEGGRWTSIHELVLKSPDGRLWRAFYERGLTEYQDLAPFEDEGDFIEFEEVERKVVEHYEYEGVS